MDEGTVGGFAVGAACRIDLPTPAREIAEIPVGLDPEGIAVDTRRRRAYVACSRSDFVAVVDLDALERIGEEIGRASCRERV